MDRSDRKGASALWRDEKGISLVVGIILVAMLVVMGFTTLQLVSSDSLFSGRYRYDKQALFTAEAGVNEALSRLRGDAQNSIPDNHPTQSQWSAYIGTVVKSQGKGYNSANAMHLRVDSIQTALDYTVKIVHGMDGAGNVLYWGDANGDGIPERSSSGGTMMRNIYVITSEGNHEGLKRTVQVEAAPLPPVTVPGALYVKATTTVQGSSTNIIGNDTCGGPDRAGIVTTQAVGSVTLNGGPNITGMGGVVPNIAYGGTSIDVSAMVNRLKPLADFKYVVASATHTASTVPGPGDGWGTPVPGPTLQSPSVCSTRMIVHYNTLNTDLRLSGGVAGCGILLVEGDLMISGNFSWYGVVIATGSVTFTGGGNKNVTGGVVAGSSADADLVGGNANIVYCSAAVNNQLNNRPLQVLGWWDVR